MLKRINISGIVTYTIIFLVIVFLISFVLFKLYPKKTVNSPSNDRHKTIQKTSASTETETSQTQAISSTASKPTDHQKEKNKPSSKQLPSESTSKSTAAKKHNHINDHPQKKDIRKDVNKTKVIQYETVRDEKKHPDHALMKKRKEFFGIEKSLDMIIRSDEKVQVGDSIAPIKKIADRLQLNQGKIIENDLTDPFHPDSETTHDFNQQKSIESIDKQADKAFQFPITNQQESREPSALPSQKQQKTPETNKISTKQSFPIELGKPKPIQKKVPDQPMERLQFVPGYSFIRDKKAKTSPKQPENNLSPSIPSTIYSVGDISPETRLDVYPPTTPKPYEKSTYLGIRVVRPGANIWEIHFDLLREYFNSRDIKISPLADEPKKSGESSGVGKILKFSEQLVNIYNLETQTFENNLDVIHPMSVIVIYNMTQIFGILDQIDYSVIDRIEFDGESLWVPSQ
jgi:F0F1-type ATP synthase membrane subunit b/b'